MEKIAILYAPAKGSTEKIARLIQQKIGENKTDLILIDHDTETSVLAPYSKIILGISTVGRDTWDSNYKKVAWDSFLHKLEKANLKGKTIAAFGLGDHILYPNHFVNALGTLANLIIKAGGNLVGRTSVEGYTFDDSEAVENGEFLGLPIDEENQHELSKERIDKWLNSISKNFGF